MTAEVKGVITHVGQPQAISDKFTKLEFVVQTEQGQYPKSVAMQAASKQIDNAKKLKVGDNVEVKFGINCREYNGKFYNTIEAFFIKSTPKGGASKGGAMQPNQEFISKPVGEDDSLGLPF